MVIATAATAGAQGNSGNAPGRSGGSSSGSTSASGSVTGKATPPGRSSLPSSGVTSAAATGAIPFAWIDDASMLSPGAVAVSVSAFRWQGTNVSEVDLPMFGASVGVAPRFQIGVNVPHVMDSGDPNGVVGGLGTSYVGAKIGVLTGSMVKLAVAPTLEILGNGALQAFTAGQSRTQFGVPVSLEADHENVRVFGSAGGFTPGVWFAGGGVGVDATKHVSISASLSRAWTNASTSSTLVGRDRNELSGTLAVSPTSAVTLYGSVGHTIATTDENGAGMSVSGGAVFVLRPPVK